MFKLTDGRVLKIVVGDIDTCENVRERDYKLMLACQQRNDIKSLVFPIIQDSCHSGVIDDDAAFVGYMLSSEGEQITLPVSREVKSELAVLLYELHRHNMIHGDPQIHNVLRLDGSLKWIWD